MLRIAILYGGRSGEHDVSRASAAAVLKNLSEDHQALLIGVSREGTWHLQEKPDPIPDSLAVVPDNRRRVIAVPGTGLASADGGSLDIDAVLPILHGSFGEDGSIQGLLDCARVAYAGAGIQASALGMDKDLSKRVWAQAGLPVVPWRTLVRGGESEASKNLWHSLADRLGVPMFLKPSNCGSSVGVSRVAGEDEFDDALNLAWRYDRRVLAEKAIVGREIECSVMGHQSPEAFPPGEVILGGSHRFYDYDAKYLDAAGALLKVPADLPRGVAEHVKSLALQAYKAVGAGGLSRVDFLLESASGNLFINEINTIPGMTSISLFPRMTTAGGVDFTTMLDRLIAGALEEHRYREQMACDR